MTTFVLGQHYYQSALSLAHASLAAYHPHPNEYAPFAQSGFGKVIPFTSDQNKDGGAISGYVASRDDAILLAFRGTVDVQNWLTNLDVLQTEYLGAMVHSGFLSALMSVWQPIDKAIRDEVGQGGKRKIWITGHSLGGALATLATRRLLNMNLAPLETYTFGQPRVGDKAFASQITSTFYRFTYNMDPVTFVPFLVYKTLNYEHVGQLKYIAEDGNVYDSPSKWMQTAQMLLTLTAPKFKSFLLERLKDHSMDGYVSRMKVYIDRLNKSYK